MACRNGGLARSFLTVWRNRGVSPAPRAVPCRSVGGCARRPSPRVLAQPWGWTASPGATQGSSGRSGAEAEGHQPRCPHYPGAGARGAHPGRAGRLAMTRPVGYRPSVVVGVPGLARLGAGKNLGCTIRKGAASGRGLVWSLRSPPLHSSLLACAEPRGRRWVRCQPRSPMRCCWPWMRPRPTPSVRLGRWRSGRGGRPGWGRLGRGDRA